MYQDGKVPVREIPARPNEDYDSLVGELILRFTEFVGMDRKEAVIITDEVNKLKQFKKYVHERLDAMNIPSDPEPESNAKHGCRIEGRLNFVQSRLLMPLPHPTKESVLKAAEKDPLI